MSSNLRIACRFLAAKKRAMLLSLSCTILGVGLFIVTQATTSGFEKFYIKAVLGADGAIVIENKLQDTLRSTSAGAIRGANDGRKLIAGVEEPALVMEALRRFENILGASAIVRATNVVARSAANERPAQVFGVEIDEHIKVSDLAQHIVAGSLEDFRRTPTDVLIGRELADELQITAGDSFLIDSRHDSRRYRVAGLYQTGISDIDKVRIYFHLSEARSLLKRPFGVSSIQVSLRDPERAVEEALHLESVLGYSAKPWQKSQKVWLEVFGALRVSSGITVTVFILIASLAMFSTLAMVVLEKTKDIAILRAMGYERRDITEIFLWQAMMVLIAGSLAGALFGWLGTWAVAQIPLNLRGIIVTKHFVVDSSPWHYVAAIAIAAAMVTVASLVPARRAARLEPGDIVRGTAQ